LYGDWQIFVGGEVGVAPPVGAGSPGAIDAPLDPAAAADDDEAGAPALAVVSRVGYASTHVQLAGQSESTVHVLALGAQYPGKEVVVVHMSGGAVPAPPAVPSVPPTLGILASAPPPLELDVPVPAVTVPLPPEHAPETVGWHVNPSPHSASALHGSCHLNMQVETFVVVHVAGGAKHCALGGQAEPPEQDSCSSVWQTMPDPQSAFVVHEASTHTPYVACWPASAFASCAQTVSAGQGAGVGVVVATI
jgi:hypothetical protein